MVIETLRTAQRFGFFGPGPIEAAIEHAMTFVEAIGPLTAGTRIVDLGSGGGLPGLVLAERFPECDVVLVDRRQKRSDFLELAVHRLRWAHVEVRGADVREVSDDVMSGRIAPFGIVTARSFGPPESTLRTAVGLLAPAGRIVISEPPGGDRWPADLLTELDLAAHRHGRVSVFSSTV